MKNTVISALLVLFVLLNGYLLYKTVYQQIRLTRLERKNSDLVVSNANYEEINHYHYRCYSSSRHLGGNWL